MCAGIANIIIKYGPIIKKKKKKATRPTLFENFMLLQYNNFFFWPYVVCVVRGRLLSCLIGFPAYSSI